MSDQYLLKVGQVFGTFIYDIETVPLTETFAELEEMNPVLAYNWFNECDKMRRYRNTQDTEGYTDQELYEMKASLYPEFAKVVSLSGGFFKLVDDELKFYYTCVTDEDETVILNKTREVLNRAENKNGGFVLGGYNIKIFDTPFMIKRYAINGLTIPNKFNCIGKKPWEVSDVDLADVWKIGSYDKFMKLDALAGAFGVKSSKEELTGSEVRDTYYSDDEDRMEKIENYCIADTITTAGLFRKMAGIEPTIDLIQVDL